MNIEGANKRDKPKEEDIVPLPEGDPDLIELALRSLYYLRIYTTPAIYFNPIEQKMKEIPNGVRKITVKQFNRQKITANEWRQAIRFTHEQPHDPQNTDQDYTPFHLLVGPFLGMSNEEYANLVDPHRVHRIIKALILRTKGGLPNLSIKLRHLIFEGGADLDGEEEECYTMYVLLKKFAIKPWEIQDQKVYAEDISAMIKFEELFKKADFRRAEKLKRQQEDAKKAADQELRDYLLSKKDSKLALPPMPPPDIEETEKQQPPTSSTDRPSKDDDDEDDDDDTDAAAPPTTVVTSPTSPGPT